MLIYKIFRADEWAALQSDGKTSGAPVDLADGFAIHGDGGVGHPLQERAHQSDQSMMSAGAARSVRKALAGASASA